MDARMIVEDATHAALIDRLIRRLLSDVILRHDVGHWLTLRDTEHWYEGAEDNLSWQGRQQLPSPMEHARWNSHLDAQNDVEKLRARNPRLNLRGTVDGKPLGIEGMKWRLRVMAAIEQGADVVVIGIDTDGDADRITGARQAGLSYASSLLTLIAAPHQDAEGWLIVGLGELKPHERSRHAEVCDDLGFDPMKRPHRLTAHPNDAQTDAKRVLQRLLFGTMRSRALSAEEVVHVMSRCFTSLDEARRHGVECGLSEFIEAVETELPRRLGLHLG